MRLWLGIALASALVSAPAEVDVDAVVQKLFPKNNFIHDLRMPEIVRELRIGEGSRVADVGCGYGELSLILYQVVGSGGRVFAEDIDEKRLRATRRLIKKNHARNVSVVHGTISDPMLPAHSLDGVMIVNSYHEMTKYEDMLRHIRDSLKSGGHLVIVDNRPLRTGSRPREKQTNNHVLSPELAEAELRAAGFRVLRRDDGYIDDPDQETAHWLMVAEPAGVS
jgi:ubiquinone/menaquinone biosynthesis C-methylase UbiE